MINKTHKSAFFLADSKKILVSRTFKPLNFSWGGRAAAVPTLLIDIQATFGRHVNICAAHQDVGVFLSCFLCRRQLILEQLLR